MNSNAPPDPLGAAPRLTALRESIATRARDCGRDPASVRLVAVSKTFSADEVWPTLALGGQSVFGENRVQEAKTKWLDLRARAAAIGRSVELHLIGPLQSSKAREAVELFGRACSLRSTPAASRRRPASLPSTRTPSSPSAGRHMACRSRA